MNPRASNLLKIYPLAAFFILAYALAWLPLIFQNTPAKNIFYGFSAFGPAISAIILTMATEGKAGTQALVSRLFRWRVQVKWYLMALLAPLGLEILAILIHRLVGNTSSTIRFADWARMLPAQLPWIGLFLMFLVTIAAGEELGWRGYALPRLQARYGSVSASLILGVLWGAWHLPMFWTPGSSQYGLPIPGYILATIGYTFIYTCIFNGSKGSVLLTCLYHGASNLTLTYGNVIFPEIIQDMYLTLPALAILAMIVILLSGSSGMVGKKSA